MSRGPRLKARCPVCLRAITMRDDRTLLAHNRRAGYRPGQEPDRCPGSGAQPVDQGRLVEYG